MLIEVSNSSTVTTWKNEKISSCKLTIPSICDAQLQINLCTLEEQVERGNIKDLLCSNFF